ncbi:MAG: hypothetical protein Q8Q09_19240 [Deltaproteobacteria bacterium]|nr:hypothetical protein [Deltaproteobacteria bacterium]
MLLDHATGTASARVRNAIVPRDIAGTLEGHGAYVVSPVGPPRLWGMIAQTAANAIASTPAEPLNTLHTRATERAARAVQSLRERLIEPRLTLDAHVAIAAVSNNVAYLSMTGGVRVYRVRGKTTERLQPRAETSLAIGHCAPYLATDALLRHDWLLLGTPESFSLRAVGSLTFLLDRSEHLLSQTLLDAMLLPVHETRNGGGLAVLRVL